MVGDAESPHSAVTSILISRFASPGTQNTRYTLVLFHKMPIKRIPLRSRAGPDPPHAEAAGSNFRVHKLPKRAEMRAVGYFLPLGLLFFKSKSLC